MLKISRTKQVTLIERILNMLQKLPLDTSTFSRLRELNYLYVDKTKHIYHMLTTGHRFFLSRPRRFGKSLLVSTLKEVLTGNKAIFNDLWIDKSDYQWKEYGVINLDFSLLTAQDITSFKGELRSELFTIAQYYNVSIDPAVTGINEALKNLIRELFKKFGQVAVLVDEYDSSILKTLHDEKLAKQIRDTIQQFFTVIKSLDAEIQFVFITGVSSFAKAGLFSGIKNLQILTLQDTYASICGYTDTEIDHYFTDHMMDWADTKKISYAELRKQIKTWYNGYRFGDDVTAVYNPFSVMNALHIKNFENFWFQSGTPTFLVELLKKEHFSLDLENFEASKDFLGIFDVDNIPPLSLMFQAGYLTITGYDQESKLYKLDYPNEEVRVSFQKYLFAALTHVRSSDVERLSGKLKAALNNSNIEDAIDLMKQLFAHVPYQLHMKAEKFYHALFIMICVGAEIKAHAEYSTSHGRIDLILELSKIIYVIEIKFNKSADEALAQIEERRYYERFVSQKKPIILLGLAFKREPQLFDITYTAKHLES